MSAFFLPRKYSRTSFSSSASTRFNLRDIATTIGASTSSRFAKAPASCMGCTGTTAVAVSSTTSTFFVDFRGSTTFPPETALLAALSTVASRRRANKFSTAWALASLFGATVLSTLGCSGLTPPEVSGRGRSLEKRFTTFDFSSSTTAMVSMTSATGVSSTIASTTATSSTTGVSSTNTSAVGVTSSTTVTTSITTSIISSTTTCVGSGSISSNFVWSKSSMTSGPSAFTSASANASTTRSNTMVGTGPVVGAKLMYSRGRSWSTDTRPVITSSVAKRARSNAFSNRSRL